MDTCTHRNQNEIIFSPRLFFCSNMPRLSVYLRFKATQLGAGQAPIALGLTALLAAVLVPAMPAVTAMAIVTVGATQATIGRFRQSSARPTIMLLHAAVYFSLYAAFVCAVLYTPAATSVHALSLRTVFDLAGSVLPMAIALQAVVGGLRLSAESRQ
jgi:hypothetical protein